MGFRGVPPQPFLKWPGGKRQLLPELLWAVRGAGGFRRYHEPFLGGGALFFALARSGQLREGAFLSDVNPNLMDAYRGVRDDVEAVLRALKRHRAKHSEKYFYEVRAKKPRTLNARAARIIYLNKTCFNGLYRENSKGQFNAPFGRYKNPAIYDEENLRAVSAALQSADLAARSFASVLEVAEAGDLVYFDPPYVPLSKTALFTSYSAGGFGLAEQERLAEIFGRLHARGVMVLLSNSLTGYTRSLYKGLDIYRVMASRRINVRADRRGAVGEALIASFRLGANHSKRKDALNGRAKLLSGSMGGIERMLAKQWLLENGYDDIAALIDEVESEWRAQGKRTRRNWWEVLAGGAEGRSRVVAGRPFPVLRAAQVRQGLPVSENALSRTEREEAPSIRASGRKVTAAPNTKE